MSGLPKPRATTIANQPVTQSLVEQLEVKRAEEKANRRRAQEAVASSKSQVADLAGQEEEGSGYQGPQGDIQLERLAGGWLSKYLKLAEVSESPTSFHLFSAITVLSHLLGRRAWVSLGTSLVYAPISVFLLSPAGAARRSGAIRLATEIGQRAGAQVLKDTMTPEGVLKHVEQVPTCLIVADEAATVLNKTEYMSQLPQMLCPLMDCPSTLSRTLTKQSYTVIQPTVSVLLGCAPSWTIIMPHMAVEGGLLSRMLVVYEQTVRQLISEPGDQVEQQVTDKLKEELSEEALWLTQGELGEFKRTEAAKRYWKDWYHHNYKTQGQVDDRMTSYHSRKADHLNKLTMVLQVARGGGTSVTVDSIEAGLYLLKKVELGMTSIYQSMGTAGMGVKYQKVMDYIQKRGEVSHSRLLRGLYRTMSNKEIKETLSGLEEAQVIVARQLKNRGQMRTFYAMNPNVLHEGIW